MNKRRLLGSSAVLGVLGMVLLVFHVVNAAPPTIGGCQIFPADNLWNMDVSHLPVMANSANYIASINANKQFLHPDFGNDFGIPFIEVSSALGNNANATITFVDYGAESDPGPYPIPDNAPVEAGGGDSHVLSLDTDNCVLYELYNAHWVGHLHWNASSGAKWPFNTNALRTFGFTSADAAGLPIFPGLARYDEAVTNGVINHALRFTVSASQRAYILPATHFAGSTNANLPPMGLRVRLKASYDINGYSGASKVILQALKTYGMIVADNGSSWYISGANDTRWINSNLDQLKGVPGSAFEAVYTGRLITNEDGPPAPTVPPRNYFTTSTPTLTWNRVTNAVRYEVQIADTASFIGAVTANAGNVLSFTWPWALPDAPYFWRARACTTATACNAWGSAYDTFVVEAQTP